MKAHPEPSCAVVREHIEAYLDGELDTMHCEVIEQHCRTCGACQDIVKGLRGTIGLCRELGEAPLPAAIKERARARMRELLSRESKARGPLS